MIVNVEETKGGYTIDKDGTVKGAGEVTQFDRTGNTYGMEAWVFVGEDRKPAEGFSRPVVAA